ncbi:MAG: phage virion morphogenesis protein [Alphaproteobacteria bacterium]
MTGIAFEIETDTATAMFARLRGATDDMTPVMADIASFLESRSIDSFENQIAPDGTPWQPSQAAGERGGLTLVDKARLRDSVAGFYGSDFAGVGSNLVYARIHQLGGKAGRNQSVALPARPFLAGYEDDISSQFGVLEIVSDYLEELASGEPG